MGYKEDLKIDQNNLDEDCLRQPVLFEIYSQKLNPLYKLRDSIKLEVEQFSAKLDGIVRESASAEGKKLTEVMVQNEIARNPQYMDLQQKYLKVCSEIKENEVIRDAFNQRKDMLKLLVELYISGYWSTVEPKILKQNRTETIKEKLKEKMIEDRKIENNSSLK